MNTKKKDEIQKEYTKSVCEEMSLVNVCVREMEVLGEHLQI